MPETSASHRGPHDLARGHEVRLYSRWERDFEAITSSGGIELSGDVEGRAAKPLLTTDLGAAVEGADTIIVAAPAFAHAYLSEQLAALLEPEQLVVFQPSVLGVPSNWRGISRRSGVLRA